MPIPDNDPDGDDSYITVAGAGQYVWDVDVRTYAAHSRNEELSMNLTSPSGTSIDLAAGEANTTAEANVFNGTIWDDQAVTSVTNATYSNNVVATTLQPEGALGAFRGEDPNGEWDLWGVDDYLNGTGTLTSWSITITTCPTPPPSGAINASDLTTHPIADNSTAVGTIAVSGGGTAICDLEVTTAIRHTASGNLKVTLASPAGTTTVLTDHRGYFWDDSFDGTLWTDTGYDAPSEANFSAYGQGVISQFSPEGSFSVFQGQTPNGTWTLSVQDTVTSDTGSLNGWAMRITTCPAPVSPQSSPVAWSTRVPTITGVVDQGMTLTGTTGAWMSLSDIFNDQFQWKRCDNTGSACADIAGATGATLVVAAADVGSTLRLTETVTNDGGSAFANSVATIVVPPPVLPAYTSGLGLTGTARDGLSLTANRGTWTGSAPISYAYQWRRCDSAGSSCVDIPGATSSTRLSTAMDVGNTLRVIITATNAAGPAAPQTSAQSAVVAVAPAPTNSVPPTISGTAKNGNYLTSSRGTWSGVSIVYTYDWRRCDASGANCISTGGHGSSYRATDPDVGSTIRLTVTATTSGGSLASTTAATLIVVQGDLVTNVTLPSYSYTGTLAVGTVISPIAGTWVNRSSGSMIWVLCDAKGNECIYIVEPTATHTVTASEIGHTLRLREHAYGPINNADADSLPTPAIPAPAVHMTLGLIVGPHLTKLAKGFVSSIKLNQFCRVTVLLKIDAATAKRLHLPITVGSSKFIAPTGLTKIKVSLSAKARSRLSKLPSARVTMLATATAPDGSRATSSRVVKLHR